MTRLELAMKSGVALNMIIKYENGQRDIKKAQVQTVIRLAKVLNCTIEDLIEK